MKCQKLQKPPLYVAIHEAGHAVIMMFLGPPRWIDYLSLSDTPADCIGFVKSNSRFDRQLADAIKGSSQFAEGEDVAVSVVEYQNQAAWMDVIDLMAGNIAELRFRGMNPISRGIAIGQAVDAASARAHGTEQRDDFVQIYQRLEWLDKEAIASNAVKALEQTESLVKTHWSKIRELGRWLHETMHIDAEALNHWRERWPRHL